MKNRFVTACLIAAGVALGSAFAVAQLPGLIGMFLGIATGAYGAYTLYWTVALLKGSASTRSGTAFILLAFVVKFPLIGLGGYLAYREGPRSIEAFIIGLVMVYFALVWRAARSDLYSH